MQKKTLLLATVAVLAVLGSVARWAFSHSSSAPSANLKPFEYLGAAVAEETAKLLNGQGRIAIISETLAGIENPNVKAQIAGFRAGLLKSPGVTLKEPQEFVRDMSSDPRVWPAGQVARFVGVGADAKALVLFANLPQALSPEELATLKESKAKLLVVGTHSPLLDSLLAEGIVSAAIVGRIPPKPAPSSPETPQQWFNRVYTVLKAK